jgi:hypothetical protein
VYDKVVAYEAGLVREYGQHPTFAVRQFGTFHAMGKPEEAVGVMERARTYLEETSEPAIADGAMARLTAINAYCAGDMAGYMKLSVEHSADIAVIEVLMMQGRPDLAYDLASSLDPNGDSDASDAYLLLYVAHAQAGREGDATNCLEAAIAVLDATGADEKQFADLLRSESPPTFEQASQISVNPRGKSLWMLAMGQRFPTIRSECWDLSRKLNIFRTPPTRTIAALLDNKPVTVQ